MKELPRLDLTEDPNKKNDYIIFRNSIKGKIKKTNTNNTKKRVRTRMGSKRVKRSRKSKKGFLNIFYN